MSRLTLKSKRKIGDKKEHVGKIIIFCEGSTEFNYLDYFCKYIKNNPIDPYTKIEIVSINTEGNARHVLNYANDFLSLEGNSEKYSNYEKHLVFDCDAPKNIQNVISDMIKSPNNYVLDYTCYAFETWLVMHFQDLKEMSNYKNKKLRSLIRDELKLTEYSSKEKADYATIAMLLANDGRNKIIKAIENAKKLQIYYDEQEMDFKKDVLSMNPSTNVHILIERFIDEINNYCK